MRRRRILLVEDDQSVRELLALFLTEAYEVKQATTGAEALAILHSEPVAAVVLDYRLPDRTGLELLPEIRSIHARLPVIMLTGYGSESICASAFKLGVSDYFPKPFNAFDLMHSVRHLLASASTRGESRQDSVSHTAEPHLPAGSLLRQPDFAIQKAVKVIQQRYWDNLCLSDLAHHIGMSKYRFSRRFKEVVGIGFREHLIRVRLDRAKVLLSATRGSVTEVAQAIGFGDLPRFDKLFKRYTGVTPSAYRRRHLPPAT